MKRYIAMTLSQNRDEIPVLTAYDTLIDLMLDNQWTKEGSTAQQRITYKFTEEGVLMPYRIQTRGIVPGSSTVFDLDYKDEDTGYLYGKNLTDDEKARIDVYSKGQEGSYKEWERRQSEEVRKWREETEKAVE